MKRKLSILTILVFALAAMYFLPISRAQEKQNTHNQYFQEYNGAKTCIKCHDMDADNFFRSQHYQWKGDSSRIVNAKGEKLGKLNIISDFNTSIKGNWIGIIKNSRGKVISRGCSECHPGNGMMPEEAVNPKQLENIDCLICHIKGYQRDLFQGDKGNLEWKPVNWKNQGELTALAKRVVKTSREICLNCHNKADGGPNYKRGDLESKLIDPERDFDVHMATAGKNMQCAACHASDSHRVIGRGADMSAIDSPDKVLTCNSSACHQSQPHKLPALNKHMDSLNCTVCHIPKFARSEPTDMVRDWSKPAYDEAADKYSPTIIFQKDVTPVYAWFNGTTKAQLPGEAVTRIADGSVGIMIPQGSRDDPKSKIYGFKVHKGKLPLLAEKNWLLPISVEQFYADGKIDPAVKRGANDFYGIADAQFTWVDTTRYMGIFHGVQPKAKALQCNDCHGATGVMNWKALGYTGNPMSTKQPPRKR